MILVYWGDLDYMAMPCRWRVTDAHPKAFTGYQMCVWAQGPYDSRATGFRFMGHPAYKRNAGKYR